MGMKQPAAEFSETGWRSQTGTAPPKQTVAESKGIYQQELDCGVTVVAHG
jgi:hypothetical protein